MILQAENTKGDLSSFSPSPSFLSYQMYFLGIVDRDCMEEIDIKTLLAAIHSLDTGRVISILKTGINVNRHGGSFFDTPLYHGVLTCHKDIIKALLDFDARPEGFIWIKFSEILCKRKYRLSPDILDIFKILVESGIDLDFPLENGDTLLMEAANNGAIELVEELVKSGADINKVNRRNGFALLKAAQSRSFKTYKYLYDLTSEDLRKIAQTYLESNKCFEKIEISNAERDIISCLEIGDLNFVKGYIANAVNLNFFDQCGDTPLCITAMIGNRELTDFLIEGGADVNLGNTITGHTPLLYASGYMTKAVQLNDIEHEATYIDVLKL